MKQRFKSEVSLLILLLAAIPFAICVAVAWFSGIAGQVAGVLAPVFLFALWMLAGTYYEVASDSLLIVSGFSKTKIQIHDIRKISKSASVLASPAVSFARIEITYKRNHIIIAPKDKAGFIRALLAVNPDIEIML